MSRIRRRGVLLGFIGFFTLLYSADHLVGHHGAMARQVKSEAAAKPKRHRTAGAAKKRQIGTASWYGRRQNGKRTASGERFDARKLTAAHRTLPLGTKAKVTNLETGQSTEVTINDRGPYVKNRKIDLSAAAAKKIGITKKGVAPVKIEPKPTPQKGRAPPDDTH
jgi:rare lipoprotein A (peptidoglycan hydrolase)